jgi:hypothetical protein
METAPLKSFATWSRNALIREVGARTAAVLAPASKERVESATAIAILERDIVAAGGGAIGRDAVADKVAYTWFNRIIALRFMDANGYTGVGIVSPPRGQTTGQPEVLADAKRGIIDPVVVASKGTIGAITALLEGTRRSDDSQGEAYALLLAEYCRHWNRSMPFMFERAGDYTELLIPANLLADDSVLARAATVLTEEVCQDVEVIGWLYQFYISERKDEVFAGFKKNRKAGAAEIPAATQLFTPHWIVRYLVENSVGRLWLRNQPASRLADQMEYYVASADDESDFLRVTRPEELTVIDPACGSGHMLTYAFDLLYAVYEEEGYTPSDIPNLILTHNLYGTEIDPRAGALAAFALTMKARARQRTFFNKQVEPNIRVLDPITFSSEELDYLVAEDSDRRAEEAFWNQFAEADTFGSLIRPDPDLAVRLAGRLHSFDSGGDIIRAEILARAQRVIDHAKYLLPHYSVVVANPPYMGAKNMSPQLASFAKKQFPRGKQDLYGCFVARAMSLIVKGGFVAEIVGDTWMSISSFEPLRKEIFAGYSFDSFVHLRDTSNHPDIFGANAAFVLAMSDAPDRKIPFIRLTSLNGDDKREALLEAIENPHANWRFSASSADLAKIPATPIAYWLSDKLRDTFTKGKPLGEIAPPRNGLQTSDNGRFLRFWWEVSADRAVLGTPVADSNESRVSRWFPYNKGGEYRRWYGNQVHVVNWEQDGKEVKQSLVERYPYLKGNLGALVRATEEYFKPHVSWSAIGSGDVSFREYPSGLIFDAAANALFSPLKSTRRELLAILNSSVSSSLLSALAPTMNFVISAVAKLPVVLPSEGSKMLADVDALVEASKADWDSHERSWNFDRNSLLRFREEGADLAEIVSTYNRECDSIALKQQQLEIDNNELVAAQYGLTGEVPAEVDLSRVALSGNTRARYGAGLQDHEYRARFATDAVADLVSYAIGCMFGRYSLDKPGLILASQSSDLQDYFAQIPSPMFVPDADNVIPIVDGDWFEDDVVARFRTLLRVAFGDRHFEANLRFVTESLGANSLRDYFVKSFYKDHVLRYRKRPIYWLFSSPKGSFNALIYMHRYTSSTASTVLNEYLREFKTKLDASRQHHERLAVGAATPRERAAAEKEADRLRFVMLELDDYEHDVLYPLATQQLVIDLDEGVKVNYPKFGEALKKIPGLEASDE